MSSDNTTRLISILQQIPCPCLALELGCGDCCHLSSIWGSRTLAVGIDLDLVALRTTANRAIAVQADITRLPFGARFDLILIRHPDVDLRRRDWETALREMGRWLSGAGTLVVTTYSVAELEVMRGWLAGKVLVPLALDHARFVAPGLAGRDRFVMVYRGHAAKCGKSLW